MAVDSEPEITQESRLINCNNLVRLQTRPECAQVTLYLVREIATEAEFILPIYRLTKVIRLISFR